MDPISYPASIDLAAFKGPEKDREAKYGLPSAVKFCKHCVISNQRPNSDVEYLHTEGSKKTTINFDEDGICDASRVIQSKKDIDWEEREREFLKLLDRFRSRNGSYDCLVPGSGGKDSFYAAHVLKYKYGMHPLTVTWAPHIYTSWGWENFQRWIHAGFDNQLFTPNGRLHRLLTRLAVEKLFHPFQPFIFGQKSFPLKMAALYRLPLVFYGEQPADYGTPKKEVVKPYLNSSWYSFKDLTNFHLSGVSVDDLKAHFGFNDGDIEVYMPAEAEELEAVNVEVHCLSYYIPWHPQSCYYYSQEHGGFQPSPERTPGTYSKYNSIDDRMDDFHYYTTYIKFGIGRATYDAAQEIRSGDITREEGVALIRRFDGEFPTRFAEEVFAYLSIPEDEFPIASKMFEQPVMDQEYFMRLADQYRSPHLWKHENGEWSLRKTIWNGSAQSDA